MKKIALSVVILAKNEEHNIEACIKTVIDWVDEIVVIDGFSVDKTVEISKRLGAIVYQRQMDMEGIQRNWGYAKAKNEWVLSLDCDERVTPELRDEIMATIPNTEFNAFDMPRKNFIGDYWVRYGGWYPSANLKVFQKSRFKFEETTVHPRVFVDGKTGHLKSDLLHYSYRNFAQFLSKQNGQTTQEAIKWMKGKPKSFGWALWRAVDRFFRLLIGKKGYKDGFVGLMVAIFASLYQIMSYAKYWEMKNKKNPGYVAQDGW